MTRAQIQLRPRFSMPLGVLGSLVLALGVSGAERLAFADPADSAEQLFRDGRAAMREGRWSDGERMFGESDALDPAVGTMLNLALCEEQAGHLEKAREHLRQCLVELPPDDRRRPIAEEHFAAVDRRLALLGAVPHEDEHATGPVEKAHVAVATPSAVRLPPSASKHPPNARSSAKTVGYSLLAGGAVALLTSAVLTPFILDRKHVVAGHCPKQECDAEGYAAAADGRTLVTAATATGVAGAALAGAGLVVLLWPRSGRPERVLGVAVDSRRGGGLVRVEGRF